MTNVTKYDWKPYSSAFDGKEISAELETALTAEQLRKVRLR